MMLNIAVRIGSGPERLASALEQRGAEVDGECGGKGKNAQVKRDF